MGYKWPLVTTVLLYALTIIGAVVVGLNAGFSCPKWPLCGGTLIPPLHGPMAVEWWHRLITLLATLSIVYNAWRTWRKRREDRLAKRLALLSVILLLTQIMLGALIVVLVLPGWFTTVDVANSLLLLSVLAGLTAIGFQERRNVRYPSVASQHAAIRSAQALRKPALWTAVLIFVQTLIGGFFRHSGESQRLYGQDSYLLSHKEHVLPTISSSVVMLAVHIGFTLAVTAGVVWLLVATAKQRRFLGASIALAVLTVYQMTVGIVSLQTKLAFVPDTLHWSGAALMVTVGAYAYYSVARDAVMAPLTESDEELRASAQGTARGVLRPAHR